MQYRDIIEFHVACQTAGVTTPAPILRGIDLIALAQAAVTPAPTSLLDLDEQDVADQVRELSMFEHTTGDGFRFPNPLGLAPGAQVFTERLLEEVHAATVPLLEGLVASLRPAFDTAAQPFVVAAQQYGFTYATTSDQVIDRADEGASAAWRATRDAWRVVSPIARFRIKVSELFDVSPTQEDFTRQFYTGTGSQPLDYSVCFAAGHGWSYDGALYIDKKLPGQIDWLALAASGLHLNTPAEVRERITAKSAALR